ncbi:MAG TPA: Ig-like domain-containing protein [Gemmatimonadaceae bacterium]|nr:Ig-like domain-containing protein [Gemmatimonadaceae bacterium]
MTGRPAESSGIKCGRCGEPLRPGDRFCAFCGTAAPVAGCERCGAPLGAADRFCPRCGTGTRAGTESGIVAANQAAGDEGNPWIQVAGRLRSATAGEFEILRELGRGGMAAVYLAHEVALNRKVAIKVMSPALLTGEGMVRRFRQEAVTVANMSHPHIITIHAVRQIDDLHFFVMKFVEGRSLEHIIRSAGALPIRTVRGLLWMVGNALAYAHRRGVVHRDVKPANILIDEDGNAVVTDFGIAKLVVRENTSIPRASRGGETQTGVIVGTPTYMSPEQCLARPVSAASDQYSLGLVAYELLTGRPPFSGSPFVVMHAHTERAAPSIRELRPDCEPELDAAIQRMLAKDPQQRWPSVQHALAALNAAPLGDADPDRVALAQLSMPAPFRRSDEVLRPGASTTPEPTAGAKAPGDVKPYVAAVEIFAPPSIVEVGDTFTLSGSPRNPSGDTVPGVRLRWSSSNEQVATVDETRGTVQAISAGEVEISASVGGVRNDVRMTVVPKRVAMISVSLPPGVMRAGDRVQLVATPEDKRHEQVHTAVHWASADESIAVVSQDGVVSAKSPGEVLVWAESQGVRAMARIEVSPAPVVTVNPHVPSILEVGESAELSAKTLDAAGHELPDRPVRWSSSDSSIAEIIGDRVVRAKSAGVARLTCNSEGKLATAEVAIVLPVVAKILIEPPRTRVDLGLPVPLHAEVVSARGVRIDRPVHWKAEPANIASVDAKGVVLPLREGRATITASIDGIEASVRLEVNPPPELAFPLGDVSATQVIELEEARRLLAQSDPRTPIASLSQTAEPSLEDSVAVPVANLGDLAASSELANSDSFASTDTTNEIGADEAASPPNAIEPWQSVSAPTYMDLAGANRFAFIERIGKKRLVGAGAGALVLLLIIWGVASRKSTPEQQVVATTSGALADSSAQTRPDSAQTPVDPQTTAAAPASDTAAAAVAKLTITALKPLRVGDTAVLRAKLGGDPKAQLGTVTWSSSAPKIARIDQRTGRVIAMKEGSATITGSANGATATVQLRVVAAGNVVLAGKVAVAQILVSDVRVPVHPGDTIRITAAPLDAKGASLLDRKVAWQSTHPDIATVDAYGLVTAKAVGSTEIVASSEQEAARVPVTVTAKTVTFADPVAALRSGAERLFTAITGHDVRQLAALMAVDSPDDQKNLDWLVEKARSSEANLRPTRPAQAGKVNTRDAEATQDFVFTLGWTAPNGQAHEEKYKFRARSTRGEAGWSAATVRALDKLE